MTHRNERIVAAIIVAFAVIAAVVVYRFSRQEVSELAKQTLYVPKKTHMTPEVELLQQYVRIDTTNPPGNELPAAQWLAKMIEAAGVHAEIIESAPRRANLYARIKGKRPDEGLLLLHHMDVVPADPKQWKKSPFAAEIYLNQVYGRGSFDMKGTGICELRAFLDVAKSGRIPERDIVFLAVADEEQGSVYGMRWLVEHRPDVLAGIRYSINEGGITEMMEERLMYYGIEIGTKQTVTLLLRAPSRAQLQRTRIALEPWFVLREPQHIIPEVKRLLSGLAPQTIAFRPYLENIDRTVAAGDFWQLPIGYRELTQNGVWAEKPERSGSEWEMRTYLFDLPDTDPEPRVEWLRKKVEPFGVRISQILHEEGAAPLTSDRTPFFELLKRDAKRTFGDVPVGIEILNKESNDSRFLRRRGIAAYGINPYMVDFFQSQAMHGVDERVRVDWFAQGVEFLRQVVNDYAFAQ